jgi:Tol biopolymer transport system component
VLQRDATMGRYAAAPGGSGYLFSVRSGTLFAVPFDPGRMETQGTPLRVVDDVIYAQTLQQGAQFSVSQNGTLAYQRGNAVGATTLQWLDSTGKRQPLLSKAGDYGRPRLSPDGNRVALDIDGDVWTHDWRKDIKTRLTSDGSHGALWSLDGRFVLFNSAAGLSWTRSDGGTAPQVLIPSRNLLYPWSFSPDGKRLAYLDIGSGGYDLYTVPIENDGRTLKAGKPEAFLATPADERYPSFSPDGHWMVYASDESGTFQVYVRAFPDTGDRQQISSMGGTYPEWSRDGHTLFFRTLDNRIMTANYTVSGKVFRADKPQIWSETRLAEVGTALAYDVAPDGKRVVAVLPAGDSGNADSATHVSILFNLFDELQRRAAGK